MKKIVAGLAAVAIAFAACKKDKGFVNQGPQFSLDKFEQNIIDYVKWGGDKPIAWAYTISVGGTLKRSHAYGSARLPVDNQMDFTLDKEINIASITKFYTAIGAMQLIYENGLTIDSTIAKWLPASWQKGPGVQTLTFKDLLTHRSGLNSINSKFDSTLTYSGLQACIQTGIINPKTRNYLNVNFALFRVLIPSLWSALPSAPPSIDIENDANTQFMYLLYMQYNVFDPLNLPLVGCYPEDRQTSTLYYNVNDSVLGNSGVYYGDWNPTCGGGGYFMTVHEMAKVNAYFEHTQLLLPNDVKKVMKDNYIGFEEGSSMELHGKYYGKGGSISNGSAGQGVVGEVVIFPFNGVDCVVIMNTQGNTFNDPNGNNSIRAAIYQAYNDAWE